MVVEPGLFISLPINKQMQCFICIFVHDDFNIASKYHLGYKRKRICE